ncbi:MAG TPA: UbiD family decarboxylase, partial [Rhizobiales bacterium]|nr:UbiD family decarboxylase [Hyphomicrobiales bacterium]
MSIARKHILSLRDFLAFLEQKNQLVRIDHPVSTVLEMTQILKRLVETGGPAVVFENPRLKDGSISPIPVLANLFGTVERTAWGLGCEQDELRSLGQDLAFLRAPT